MISAEDGTPLFDQKARQIVHGTEGVDYKLLSSSSMLFTNDGKVLLVFGLNLNMASSNFHKCSDDEEPCYGRLRLAQFDVDSNNFNFNYYVE